MTVGRALANGIEVLCASDSARADALLLLARALGCRREWILAHDDAPMTGSAAQRFLELCAVRSEGRPIAYVLGEAGFYGRTFAIDDRVLVPRPETECLVDAALRFLKRSGRSSPALLDVGCGSGAIACTLAAEIPDAAVLGTDDSQAAVEVAAENARRLDVASRCAFECGDLAAPAAGRRFDVVLANLPYVPTSRVERKPHPLGFEPRRALDGGRDGLDVYRRFLPAAPALLEPGGLLLLEAAPPQMDGLLDLVGAAFPGSRIAVGDDLSGLARYVELETASGLA